MDESTRLCLWQMISAQQFVYESPSPSRVINPYYKTPPSTRRYSSKSPLRSPESMGNKSSIIKAKELLKFWKDNINNTELDRAEMEGCLFSYDFNSKHPHKRDPAPMQRWWDLMVKQLKVHAHGCFVKAEIQDALTEFQAFVGRDLSSKEPVWFQAAHYKRYFSDAKAIQRDSTTGTRLPMHVRAILNVLDTSELYIVNIAQCARNYAHIHKCLRMHMFWQSVLVMRHQLREIL